MLAFLLKSSIEALILAIGMTATTEDITYLWRRPVLLTKSIIAMYIVMPVVAVLMARLFNLPSRTELALVILAICAGAPLLPKKLIKFGGNPSYVFSLIVTTSLLAIATVPVSLQVLSGIFSFDTTFVSPADVAVVILKSFLLPLGIGMLLRKALPKLANRICDPLLKISSMVMAVCALVALAYGFRLVLEVGWATLFAFGLFTTAALLTGHLLGGPAMSDRASLAIACCSRHIGLALLIAANARGRHALALVIAYILASAVVSMLYIVWIKKRVVSTSTS